MRTPSFWQRKGPTSWLLWPLSLFYWLGTILRKKAKRLWKSPVPIICVGNLTMGGAGKTPVAIALAKHLKKEGVNVQFLTRGYGGDQPGPLKVDLKWHNAKQVGDEPMLLAAVAPTWVSRDRVKGARRAIADGADVIVMDDGFQNPTIHKDLALIVVDGGFGFGNRRLFPSGPLRESIVKGLRRAHGVVIIGEANERLLRHLPSRLPVVQGYFKPASETKTLKGKKVIAFAGIGRPQKFFDTLEELGAKVVATYKFPDHHYYTSNQIRTILWEAKQMGAVPVTTEKDYVRLWPKAREEIIPVRVSVAWKDDKTLERVLKHVIG